MAGPKARSASSNYKSAKRVFQLKVPAIHVLVAAAVAKDVDARDKRGHDEANNCA
jgi:hypothetical protein